jgi:hypothetical protein
MADLTPNGHERLCSERIASSWTCFHCGESFTDRSCAAIHFGASESAEPACKIKGDSDHYLVQYIRDLEAQLASYRSETDAITRAWYAKNADHSAALRQAEEGGYNKGVRDMAAEPAIAERIAAARYQALYDARNAVTGFSLAGCNSALEAVQKLLTAAESRPATESER